jgi:predicted esterase
VIERIVATSIHGRYLATPPAVPGPAPILAGFHGYAESAETQLERLKAIPESSRWLTISVQALHRFYQRRMNLVVASWMTSQDREVAIEDNLAYVSKCINTAIGESAGLPAVVFAGFSQGVAMAFRAAVSSRHRVLGVIAVGGDIPPEITPGQLARLPAVLIARGVNDELYGEEQFTQDEKRLLACSVRVRALRLSAGHEWPGELTEPESQFLNELHPRAEDAGGDVRERLRR